MANGPLKFEAPSGEHPAFDGEVLACDPPTLLEFRWGNDVIRFEIANNGHVEALMIALLMAGVWLLVCARRVLGAGAVALAMVVKPYALFVLPAFWRPWDASTRPGQN